MAIRPTNKGKLNQRGCNIRKKDKKRRGGGGGATMCHNINCCPDLKVVKEWCIIFFNNKSNSTSFQGGPTIMFELSPSSNIKEGVELKLPYMFYIF